MPSPIKTVGVIGAGVIGASWTALFLAKGLKVIVTDPAPGAEAKIRDYLQQYCSAVPNASVAPAACLENFTFVNDIDPYLGSLDLIQEVSCRSFSNWTSSYLLFIHSTDPLPQNGPERVDFKRRLFAHLDAKTPSHVLIASSSSGLPASQFTTECTNNPSRILIGHPFNPPHLVPLVEVVPHPGTSQEYVTAAYQFYQSLNKDPVVVKQETPGFIANRLQAAVCAEAYSLISRGIVSAEDLGEYSSSAHLRTYFVLTYRRQNRHIWSWPAVGSHRTDHDQYPRWRGRL